MDARASRGSDSTRYPLNRGLARGLHILQALNKYGESSTLQLAKTTCIPRSTVHRLLESLRALGYVDRSHLRDAYHLTALVQQLSSGFSSQDWTTEIAVPKLEELSGVFIWPTSVSIYKDGAMVIRASTHRESPLSLNAIAPGTKFPMLTTSIGRAYLAFCPPAERSWILNLLLEMQDMKMSRERAALERSLDKVRDRGFGLRERSPESRTSSLAVPILIDGRVHACLSILWIHSALRLNDAIDHFFQPLKEAAESIAGSFEILRMHKAVLTAKEIPSLRESGL